MSLKKIAKESVVLHNLADGLWAGSNIAEVLPASGDTVMSCGIHELFASQTVVEKAPVDDILYVLEGEIEITSDDITETFRAGDFAYLRAGSRQTFTVRKHAKHIYVSYPCNWAEA